MKCFIIFQIFSLMDPELKSGQETYQYMELCRWDTFLFSINYNNCALWYIPSILFIYVEQGPRFKVCKRPLKIAVLLLEGQPPHVHHWATQGGGIGLQNIHYKQWPSLVNRLSPFVHTSQWPTAFFSPGSLIRSLPERHHSCEGYHWEFSFLLHCCHNRILKSDLRWLARWLMGQACLTTEGSQNRLGQIIKESWKCEIGTTSKFNNWTFHKRLGWTKQTV